MGRVTVAEAAERLGCSRLYVRLALQQQRLPIGSACKMSSKWTYHISEELLDKYIGEKHKILSLPINVLP